MQCDDIAASELLSSCLSDATAVGSLVLFFGWWEQEECFEDEEKFPEWVPSLLMGSTRW